MMNWRQVGELWLLEPPQAKGRLEFIGGSGLGTSPQLSYRRLLEALAQQGWAVQAWPFVPGFDHQLLAVQAWRAFRRQQERQGPGIRLPTLRLGHSMGCKLQLLAPDQGRGCGGCGLISFNNFAAGRSIPLLGELAPRLGVTTEFSPSPAEALRLIETSYGPPHNLVIRFRSDELDQSAQLFEALQRRPQDDSQWLELAGDHLTPASAGLRQQFLGGLGDGGRQRQLERLASAITQWWERLNSLRSSR
ncbi:MAG: DUF1350 family protein [Synechococcus lacustris]